MVTVKNLQTLLSEAQEQVLCFFFLWCHSIFESIFQDVGSDIYSFFPIFVSTSNLVVCLQILCFYLLTCLCLFIYLYMTPPSSKVRPHDF